MFPEFCNRKTEQTENSNFRLFAANGSLFFLEGKRLTVIDDCCFSKRAHLCILESVVLPLEHNNMHSWAS